MSKFAKVAVLATAAVPAFIFTRLTRWIPLNGIRFKDGGVQTPVVWYEHRETGRILIFAAMMHIGEREYYASIQEIIDIRTRYTVLYERVKPLTDEQKNSLTEKEQSLFDGFGIIKLFQSKLQKLLDLAHQRDALAYLDHWINTDIEMYGLIRIFAAQDIDMFSRINDHDLSMFEKDAKAARLLFNSALRNIVPLVLFMRVAAMISPKLKKEKKIILDMRNKIAMEEITKRSKDEDIITIWGAEHLPQLDREIRKLGYVETKREWYTAYRDRGYKFISLKVNVNKDEQVKSESA